MGCFQLEAFETRAGLKIQDPILKALSTLWPQQPHQFDDPFGDPEHIFRDSDMVVRLDEPTSIIALALK